MLASSTLQPCAECVPRTAAECSAAGTPSGWRGPDFGLEGPGLGCLPEVRAACPDAVLGGGHAGGVLISGRRVLASGRGCWPRAGGVACVGPEGPGLGSGGADL